jgi:hypothetical protein
MNGSLVSSVYEIDLKDEKVGTVYFNSGFTNLSAVKEEGMSEMMKVDETVE